MGRLAGDFGGAYLVSIVTDFFFPFCINALFGYLQVAT